MVEKILVVEDQDDSFLLIHKALSNSFNITRAKTVAEAMAVYDEAISLALIDRGLPDGDGYQFCDWIRSRKMDARLPIIFLSANDSVESRITGFSIGGDDYIGKPFNFMELKARVEAKLKSKENHSSLVIKQDGVRVDLRAHKVAIMDQGKERNLDLTPIEFKIINLLISEPNRAFSRDEILNNIWGKDIYIFPRCVDTHVSKLRTKMGAKAANVQSVHGVGYKFAKSEGPEGVEEDQMRKVQ